LAKHEINLCITNICHHQHLGQDQVPSLASNRPLRDFKSSMLELMKELGLSMVCPQSPVTCGTTYGMVPHTYIDVLDEATMHGGSRHGVGNISQHV
jgi:hypothetical protein